MLGCLDPGPKTPDAKQHWRQAQQNKQNIRQYTETAKQARGEMQMPQIPGKVEEQPPQEINVYTDGAVKIPACQQLAIGGFGIWWKDREGEEHQ